MDGNGVEKEPYEKEELTGALKQEQQPPTDFKIAEIWIRNGQLMLDGSQEFWQDKIRAVGILQFCQDIVKTAKPPKDNEPKIEIAKGLGPLNFLRNRLKGRK